jgi:hypothetical protein
MHSARGASVGFGVFAELCALTPAPSQASSLNACLTTSATESPLIPRRMQSLDSIQMESFFVPLLELHDTQHLAIFSRETIFASLMMCSHVATDFRDPFGEGDSNIGIRQ